MASTASIKAFLKKVSFVTSIFALVVLVGLLVLLAMLLARSPLFEEPDKAEKIFVEDILAGKFELADAP